MCGPGSLLAALSWGLLVTPMALRCADLHRGHQGEHDAPKGPQSPGLTSPVSASTRQLRPA